MKQNINGKIDKIVDANVFQSNKIRESINMNLEGISKTSYRFGCSIYDDSKRFRDEFKYKGTLIVRVPTSERRNGLLIRIFHLSGFRIFVNNVEFSRNLQVYKSADNQNDFFIINTIADRKDRYILTTKSVLNEEELIDFYIKYMDEVESYLPYDYDDSIEDGFYEFIK